MTDLASEWRDRLWLIPRSTALAMLACASTVALALSAALSTGGHATIDSVQQIYEALSGTSVSWNPPFMSALLQSLGVNNFVGAGISTAVFVAFVCIAFWSVPLLIAFTGRSSRISLPALLACLLLVLNPVLIIYGGIVWKDVLFAALVSMGTAMALLSLGAKAGWARVVFAILAVCIIGILPLVRQQGWVIGPVLLALPVLAMAWTGSWTTRRRVVFSLAMILVCVLAHSWGRHWSGSLISGSEGQEMSVGFRSIQSFDLAGMEAFSRDGPLVGLGASPEALEELQQHYTPERIDFLGLTPSLKALLSSRQETLAADWLNAIMEHPSAYLTHRGEVLKALFGGHSAGACLPVHFGIDGFDHQLNPLGLVRGSDVIDIHLFKLSIPLFETPIFKHWFYLGILIAMALLILVYRRGRTRIALLVVGGSTALFYLSFVPTAIACDFRYLFPAIPTLTMMAAAYFFGWSEFSQQEEKIP